MIYAIIIDGNVNNLAIAKKPINENWILIGSLPVHIGDDYVDGAFYRNGEMVITEEERLYNENADMKAALELLGVSVDG